nr:BC1 [Tomato leaf curl Bangladesh betasatellite]
MSNTLHTHTHTFVQTSYSSPIRISTTGASCIINISIDSTMSSCRNSQTRQSLYMTFNILCSPSSKLLKSKGGMIPSWPYGIRKVFFARAGDLVEHKSILTRTELSSLIFTSMVNSIPFSLFIFDRHLHVIMNNT